MIKKNRMKKYSVYSYKINWSDGLLQDTVKLYKSHNMYFVKFHDIKSEPLYKNKIILQN